MLVDMNHQNLAHNIKQARNNAGLTQDELADKIGVSYSSLSKLEQGAVKDPSFFTILKISKQLSVPIDELIQETAQNSPESPSVPHSTIKLALLDVHGVLISDFQHVFSYLGEKHHRDPALVEDIFWRLDHATTTGAMTLTAFEQEFSRLLDLKETINYLEAYKFACKPHKQAHELLTYIRECGIKTALVTNNYPGTLKLLESLHALPNLREFNFIFESHRVGHAKPSEEMYEFIEKTTKLEGSELLLIDDLQVNLDEAQEFGWNTVRFSQEHPAIATEHVHALLKG